MKKYIKSEKQGAPNINSYVYNALSDVAFNLTQDGYNVNKSEFQNAFNNFMRKFFADDFYGEDDALWEVMNDDKFGFRGVQDVGYDDDGNIIVTFDHDTDRDMIAPIAEELLSAFRQYGYNVHDWNTNGANVFILTP